MKLGRFTVAALLTLTMVTLIQPSTVSAVTYGDPIESPQIEFPEVVPVWVGGTSLCSGTLVRQQVVLTAAHCVYGQRGPFQISVGGSTLNNGRLIDVDATWYHPRYDAAFSQNDIALLHLKTPAGVPRLGVLPKSKLKSLGKKFLIVGWGRDQNGMITGKLHRLSLNNQAAKSRKFFKGNFNPKTMVGAGRYFADEILYGGGCTGDSGGPLYKGAAGASRTILGLTSFGARGCTVYQPTVFTRVDFYVKDINKGIQLLNSRSSTAPIATGKATPAGIGPKTSTSSTTTTIPRVISTTTTTPATTTTTTTTTTIKAISPLTFMSINFWVGSSTKASVGLRVQTDSSAIAQRVCWSVSVEGPTTGILRTSVSDLNGTEWTDAGGGCANYARTTKKFGNQYTAYVEFDYRGTFYDPMPYVRRTWTVSAVFFDSLGRSVQTSAATSLL